MSQIAIRAEGLSKKYRVGLKKKVHNTLGQALTDAIKAPVRRFHRLRGSALTEEEIFWALNEISFTVKQGEVLGIIGKNGAGKSTLLKILSRITRPTKGAADVYGRVGSLLEVGTGFHPELTGRENIYLNGAVLGMRKREISRKFDEIVAFSDVERFLDTPVKHYSSGMFVRLAFSVAAHLEPEILLIDEVLAVGDIEFQKKCLGKMEDVSKQGRTVLFVSHNMSLISSLCPRVILLSAGSIVLDDTADAAINKYLITSVHQTSADLHNVVANRFGERHYLKITHVAMFDENMQQADTFAMGKELIVRVDILCKRPTASALIGLKITSRYGVTIHYFVSTWEGLHVDLSPGYHTFEFRVPQLHLFPGSYFLSIWATREGNPSDDRIEGALILSVVGRDLTGNAPNFDSFAISGCEVYAPSTCRLLESSPM